MKNIRAVFNEKAVFAEKKGELKVDFCKMSASLKEDGVVLEGVEMPVAYAVTIFLMLEAVLEPFLPRVASKVGITHGEGGEWLLLMDEDGEVLSAAPFNESLKTALSATLVSPPAKETLQ